VPGEAIDESRTLKDRAGQLALRLLSDANFLRVIASSEIVRESSHQISKRVPPVVGALVALGIGLGGTAGIGAMLGPEGFALIKEVADSVKELSDAFGKPNSEFDKLSKKIEKLEEAAAKHEASKADPSPPSNASTNSTKKELPPTKTPAPKKPTKKKPATK
jgi:hypothetical protein